MDSNEFHKYCIVKPVNWLDFAISAFLHLRLSNNFYF